MGYNSEVIFAISGGKKDVITELMNFRLTAKPEHWFATTLCKYTETEWKELIISFHNTLIKWENHILEVAALKDLYSSFDSQPDKFKCIFMRYGDHADDMEVDANDVLATTLVCTERVVHWQYEPSDVPLSDIIKGV